MRVDEDGALPNAALKLLRGVKALCDRLVEPGEVAPSLVQDAVIVALGVCNDVDAVAGAAGITNAEVKACVARSGGKRSATLTWVWLAASAAAKHQGMLAGTARSALEDGADLDEIAEACGLTIREVADLVDRR